MAEEGQYVYCIIGTGEARNFGPIGIGDQGNPVITIAYRDLGAVVSSVPMTTYVVSKETMLTHEKVIEIVMRDYTVLPVRFYTVAPNAEEVRSLLRRRYPEFKTLLRELDNKVELGLRALSRDMNTPFAEIVEEREEIKAAIAEMMSGSGEEASQRGAVTEMVRLTLCDKAARERAMLLQPQRRLCVDLCLNLTHGDDMLMNAAFLVDRDREREFDSEVQKLASRYSGRIQFKCVGPAPPDSFVNIVVKE